MPRLVNRSPKYTLHRASGQAVVKLDGRLFYLGRHNSPESRVQYDRVVAEWLANGRQVLAPTKGRGDDQRTVADVIAAYWIYAERYYAKADGTPTSEIYVLRSALRPLQRLYGPTPAAEFGPLRFRGVVAEMVRLGWCRNTVNQQAGRVRQVFKWAVSQELIPPSVYHGLQSVPGLRKGRSDAVESEPVKPVHESHVEAVLPFVSPQVAAMIRLQLLTGMRPGEVCAMRGCDLDTSGEVWAYRPASHKTQHHGHDRVIHLGPKAKAVLKPFLKPDVQAFIFSPSDAEKVRRAKQHEARKTPEGVGNVPGSNRTRRPQRQPGECYDVAAYRRAIARGCDWAFPPPPELARHKVKGKKGRRWETTAEWQARLGNENWVALQKWQEDHRWHPHQLRHNAATGLRKQYGIEVAQVILGHHDLRVTELYAAKDFAAAQKIMAEVG